MVNGSDDTQQRQRAFKTLRRLHIRCAEEGIPRERIDEYFQAAYAILRKGKGLEGINEILVEIIRILRDHTHGGESHRGPP